jgi:DeoR family transcriptional regulator, fructose operon transcriptional repressor
MITHTQRPTINSETRRSQIIVQLEQGGAVLVEDLAAQFGVSLVTIRKDLSELEERGLLRRTHGGATYAHKSLFNPSFGEKINFQKVQKQAIANIALEYIEDGDSLMLGAGSTVLALARALKKNFRHLLIITNSIPVAIELADTNWNILLTGGEVRHHSMALIGPGAVRFLTPYHADKVFFGATGVSMAQGYTTPNAEMSNITRVMLESADQAYALVDSSKLGKTTLVQFAEITAAETLITDSGAATDFVTAIKQQQLQIRIAQI